MLAFAALRYQPEAPFLRAYYGQLYSRLPLADDRDMATFAQAAALLDRLVRQDFMQVCAGGGLHKDWRCVGRVTGEAQGTRKGVDRVRQT